MSYVEYPGKGGTSPPTGRPRGRPHWQGEGMQSRLHNDWQNALWKILTNPAIVLVAAIAIVLMAAWFVIDTDMAQKSTLLPLPFAHKP
jgi:hypothetical protein